MGSSESTEEPRNINDPAERMSTDPSYNLEVRLRKPLVTLLNDILNRKGSLDEYKITEHNQILQDFLPSFIGEMRRRDRLFDLLYSNRIYYTGSYYTDLRVKSPDEYDLNLPLKFPFKNVLVEYNSQAPAFAKYSVIDQSCIFKEAGLVRFFSDGYLIPEKIKTWMQSVVDKAVSTYECPGYIARIGVSRGGPAITIILQKNDGEFIDIDLVPAIECSMDVKPPGIHGRVYEKVKGDLECFLVPKPYYTAKQPPINELEMLRLWRTHYPYVEKKLIHDMGCAKPVIKLLKLLRDENLWKILASYYLKTIVMWMVFEDSSFDYWKMDKIGHRFLDALEKLRDCVEERKIDYFFSSKCNLLEKMEPPEAYNIHHRLNVIIEAIKKDHRKLYDIFGCTCANPDYLI